MFLMTIAHLINVDHAKTAHQMQFAERSKKAVYRIACVRFLDLDQVAEVDKS